MDSSSKKISASLLSYRVHVIAMGFLLSLYADHWTAITQTSFLVAFSFAVLMAFIYIFNKTTDFQEDRINVIGDHPHIANVRVMQALMYCCAFIPVFYLKSHPYLLMIYILCFINGVFYSVPLNIFGKHFRFKNIFIIKNISAGFMWALPPAAVSYYFGESFMGGFIYFVEVFCISFTIELLWDLRDIKGDQLAGIKTIANHCGFLKTKIIAFHFLFIAFALVYFFFPNIYSYAGLLGSLMFFIFVNEKRSNMYFHSIVLLWIVVLTFRLILGE